MNREFLRFYNQELAILREQAAEFAEDYPGIAERLGGLVGDAADPMISGLLEGAAFLAARVQLKLKHEFADFTTNLIDQLAPHYLAPTPSFVLVRAKPKFGDPTLRDGRTIPQGSVFDATYREAHRNVACRFTLAEPITLWPFDIVKAEYLTSSGAFQALVPNARVGCAASLRLQLTVRSVMAAEDESADKEAQARPELRFSSYRVKSLRFHLLGQETDAVALYEQLFAHCTGVYFRMLDAFGDPVIAIGRADMIRQIGFGEGEALIPNDNQFFRGFDFLRDYFAFPRRFLGFDLIDLDAIVLRLGAKSIDIVFAFDDVNPQLAAAVRKEMFALYTAPGANLFEKRLDRIPVKSNQYEFPVIPDRSRTLDFETNRVVRVFAHVPGAPQKLAVEPLYSARAARSPTGLTYTIRRLPRRRTADERKYGPVSDYVGTDVFLSLGERADPNETLRVAELSVDALCTNRHLAAHLPVGESGADFRFLDDAELELTCVGGPTKPLEPALTSIEGRGLDASAGEVAWRLISMLSLNHLGLADRADDGAMALRETLVLFADLSDAAADAKIRGVRSLTTRPTVRRLRQASGAAAARGLEITLVLEGRAFEGSGAFLLGAVLDRFFAEYIAINHFTQTIIRTVERGEMMRWPPRLGLRGLL
ncbi:MAG TPA: type VI secretion system baseplate subunit TssF [Roseiarcus sp.]